MKIFWKQAGQLLNWRCARSHSHMPVLARHIHNGGEIILGRNIRDPHNTVGNTLCDTVHDNRLTCTGGAAQACRPTLACSGWAVGRTSFHCFEVNSKGCWIKINGSIKISKPVLCATKMAQTEIQPISVTAVWALAFGV